MCACVPTPDFVAFAREGETKSVLGARVSCALCVGACWPSEQEPALSNTKKQLRTGALEGPERVVPEAMPERKDKAHSQATDAQKKNNCGSPSTRHESTVCGVVVLR